MERRYFSNKSYLRDSFRSRVKFGENGSVPIDQAPSKSFNIDPDTGRPMSDIQRLVKVQNDVAMQAAFSQLHEFKSSYLPADMKDEDALMYQCPRLAQLPSELLEYREKLTTWKLAEEKRVAAINAQKAADEADRAFLEEIRKSWSESKETKL